jgi:hypothetical protein
MKFPQDPSHITLFYVNEKLHRGVSNHHLLRPFRQRLLVKDMSIPTAFLLLRLTHLNVHLLVERANHLSLLILGMAVRLLISTCYLEAHAIAGVDIHLGSQVDSVKSV